ncbi:hypothetical protein OFO11_40260, partial [Escherichia coli]|nr:hypothetical protein [Escherichia coli]
VSRGFVVSRVCEFKSSVASGMSGPVTPLFTAFHFYFSKNKKARGITSRKLLHDNSREQLIEL